LPTYNEDLLVALGRLQSAVTRAINETNDLDRNLSSYTTAAQTALKTSIKALAWPSGLSAQLLEWDGTPTPE
jgi:hypothetical protein